MTAFTDHSRARWIIRHGGAVQVEAFYHGYGLRLSDGHLLAARIGSGPETFETRASAQRAAERMTR